MNVVDESRQFQLNVTTGNAYTLAYVQRKSRDNITPKVICNEAGRNITKLLHPICLFLKKKLCPVDVSKQDNKVSETIVLIN